MTATSDFDSFSLCDEDDSPGTRTPISEFDCVEGDADSLDNVSTEADDMSITMTPKDLTLSKSMMDVKLFDHVESSPARTRLNATARPYVSTRTPPAGIQGVVAAAKAVLENHPGVSGVQVTQGGMGETWTMLANTQAPFRNQRNLLADVKSALLSSAEQSQDTYIMGYDLKPFTKISKGSFFATIATIPDYQQNTACWDMYKYGYCRRCATCCWSHPSETQKIRLIVRVQVLKIFELFDREAQAICHSADE